MSPWTRVKRPIIVRIGEIRELGGWEHADWPGYFFDRRKSPAVWCITEENTGRLVAGRFRTREEALKAMPELEKRVRLTIQTSKMYDRMIEQFRELLHLHEIEEEKRDEPQERASS